MCFPPLRGATGSRKRLVVPYLLNCCDQIASGVKPGLIYFFSRICAELSVMKLLLFRNLVEVKGSLQVSF
jgi:hypothetical protein